MDHPNTPHRLRLSAAVAERLRVHHLAPGKHVESLSVLLGHSHVAPDGSLTIVVAEPDDVLLFAPDCFRLRAAGAVVLHDGIAAQINHRMVAGGYTSRVVTHDHHFAQQARFSGIDDRGDLADARNDALAISRLMPPGKRPVTASLLLAQSEWAARVIHGANPEQRFSPMRIDAIGGHYQCLSRPRQPALAHAQHLRHEGVISLATQQQMRHFRLAIVGLGGLGSIAAEAAARMGFKHLTLIDADHVEASNLNRLQGVGMADVGRLKVDVLAERLCALFPDLQVHAVAAEVFGQDAQKALEQADGMLGCVDNEETRWWLNRFSVQYMLPWWDAGVLIETDPALVTYSRVSAVLPGAGPCGHCSPIRFFDRQVPQRFLDADTRTAMRSAGYVQGASRAADGDPSIYPLNMQAVSAMMGALLEWLEPGRAVLQNLYQRSDRPRIERVEAAAFLGQRSEDCPLCQGLLGQCRAQALPAATALGSELALGTA